MLLGFENQEREKSDVPFFGVFKKENENQSKKRVLDLPIVLGQPNLMAFVFGTFRLASSF